MSPPETKAISDPSGDNDGSPRSAGAGESWTLHLDDAEAVARCRAQGGTLVQRDDDRPDVIAQRLIVYRDETAPLLAHYRQAGLLHTVDATGAPADVQQRALEALAAPQ